MLILIKTPTITFSLDIDPQDDINVLYQKVSDRTEHKRFQFNLLYAGETLVKGNIASNMIKRESTIHMIIIKEMKFVVLWEGREYPVELPNNAGLKVSHLKRQIRTSLRDRIEPLQSFNTQYEIYSVGGTHPLNQNSDLRQTVGNFGVVELRIIPNAPPPPSMPGHSAKSKLSKAMLPKKSYDDSALSASSSSDDEYDRGRYTSGTSTTTTSSKPTVETPPPPEEEEFDQDQLLNSFVESSISSDVEIVFCFDTTGSMSSIIKSVRSQVTQTVNRLMKDIPNIKIGIMALGDYCDQKHVLLTLDLSQDVQSIVHFINAAPNTTGGDEPEAYEYALREAKKLSWSSYTSKAFVMIGDACPHPPSFTDLQINWFKECDDLFDMGIKIYGVRALGNSVFYDDIAERTGGICINFKKFNLITEMFLAICYREASKDKFKEYQKEIEEKNDLGEDAQDMKEILQDLNKENFTVLKEGETLSDLNSNPDTSSNSGVTTSTVTSTSMKRANVVFKTYGKPSTIKVNAPWYDISTDKDPIRYYYNPNTGYFDPALSKGKKAASEESKASAVVVTGASGEPINVSVLFDFDGVEKAPLDESKKQFRGMVVGDSGIGKTTFINSINYIGKTGSILLEEKIGAPITRDEFKRTDFFLICLTQHLKDTYSHFNNYLTEIRKRDPMKPIIAVILMKDQTPSTSPNIDNLDEFRQIYSLAHLVEYSHKVDDKEIRKILKSIESKLSKSKSCSIM